MKHCSTITVATVALLGVLSGQAWAVAAPPSASPPPASAAASAAASPPPSAAASPAPPPTAPPSPAAKTEARERFNQGLRLFETGENAAALAEFKRAYDLIPNVMVLYNMAFVYAAMNRPVEAADALDKVLAPDAPPLGAAQKQKAQRVRDEQTARIAQILVVTNQPATIEIDGVEVGHTPLPRPLRVSSGTHVLSAVAPGTVPSRRELTLAGQVTETVTLTLQPTESGAAHLVLTVSVPGADVLINDKPVGRTPLSASVAVPPGLTRVEARRAGYLTARKTIRLDEGSNGALELTLEEDPAAPATVKGSLRLAVSEPGAEGSIDGVVKPITAGMPMPIIAGPHALRILRSGFEPFEQQIEIAAGKQTSLAVNLVPTIETKAQYEDSAHARRIVGWSVVAGGGLVTAGAVVYAILTHNDVSQAQAQLDAQLVLERTRTADCYHGPDFPIPGKEGYYMARLCAETKAAYQDNLDSTKLRRGLAYGGMGLGIVIAGVGSYLLATGSGDRYGNPSPARISLWGDGQSGGFAVAGRF
jgi:PEGA domain